MKRLATGLAALIIANVIWLPCLHFFFAKPATAFRQPQGLSPMAKQLAARHLQFWTDPASRAAELKKMRVSNAEWDSLIYLAFVVLVPVMILAALILQFWQIYLARRTARKPSRNPWLAETLGD